MAKATDKQKKNPILQKNNKSKTNKRNNEESTLVDDIEKNSKKIKISIINKSIDKNDNDENKENGSTDSEEKSNDGKNITSKIIDDLKTDSEAEKSDDDETENSTNKDVTSNKIVPMFQARPQVNDFDSNDPIFEQLPEDANEASSMHITGYCETLVGFDSTGKKNMLENLSATEIPVLRGWVRKEGFRMLKFLSSANLSMNSSIMTKMYAHIGITDESVKIKKYTGLRYLLQRQLNSKRNYCIATIASQMKGMIFLF